MPGSGRSKCFSPDEDRHDPHLAALLRRLVNGSVGFENELDANGDRLIWLPRDALAKLRHLRRPGESFSDVILRLAKGG